MNIDNGVEGGILAAARSKEAEKLLQVLSMGVRRWSSEVLAQIESSITSAGEARTWLAALQELRQRDEIENRTLCFFARRFVSWEVPGLGRRGTRASAAREVAALAKLGAAEASRIAEADFAEYNCHADWMERQILGPGASDIASSYPPDEDKEKATINGEGYADDPQALPTPVLRALLKVLPQADAFKLVYGVLGGDGEGLKCLAVFQHKVSAEVLPALLRLGERRVLDRDVVAYAIDQITKAVAETTGEGRWVAGLISAREDQAEQEGGEFEADSFAADPGFSYSRLFCEEHDRFLEEAQLGVMERRGARVLATAATQRRKWFAKRVSEGRYKVNTGEIRYRR